MMKTWGVDGAFFCSERFSSWSWWSKISSLSQILGGESGALRIWGLSHKLGVAALGFFSLIRGDPWRGFFFSVRFSLSFSCS